RAAARAPGHQLPRRAAQDLAAAGRRGRGRRLRRGDRAVSDASSSSGSDGVRLQKVLAGAGVASRRVAEQYIVAGRVRVNGVVVTELGTRIDPANDLVDVDGTAVQLD